MAIWIKNEITPESTLAVQCLSSMAASKIREPNQPERQATCDVLRELAKRMEDAGIEKFGEFYHGLIHPFDSYDVLASLPKVSAVTLKRRNIPDITKSGDGAITVGCFKLLRTTGVGQMLLLGKSSTMLKLVPVWLLAEKDVPKQSPLILAS